MSTQDMQQLLEERIAQFNYDPSDENRDMLMEVIKTADPKGYKNLKKSQCAYEFHMILESILNP